MNKSSDPITTGLRWAARILGAGIIGMVALFYFGTGGPGVWKRPVDEMVLMAAFLTSVAGLAVAWRREWLGAALNVGGMGLFYLFHLSMTGGFPRGAAFGVIIVPGLLNLLCAWRDASRGKDRIAAQG